MTSEKAIVKSFNFLAADKSDKVKAFIGLEKNGGQRVSGLVLFSMNKGIWRLDNLLQREFSGNSENRENMGMPLVQILDAQKHARELCIFYDHELKPDQLYRITITEFDQN
jgi:hypothetical protein